MSWRTAIIPSFWKPPLRELPRDLAAGATLAIALIPDAMAGALLAGLSPIQGLSAAIVAAVLGALVTGSVFMSVGITGALSVATAAVMAGRSGTGAVVTLVFLAGALQLLFGIARFGSLTRFVSNAVMTGFVSGIGVLIVIGQLGDMLGVKGGGRGAFGKLQQIGQQLHETQPPALLIAVLTMVVIVLLERTRVRALAILIALAAAGGIAAWFAWPGLAMLGALPDQLPRLQLPAFAQVPSLLLPALALTLIALVQGAAVSESHPNPDGRYAEPSRDFVGQGIANLGASFIGGMPVGASLGNTSLLVRSGARSRLAHLVAAAAATLMILLLRPVIGQLPLAAVAGLLVLVGGRAIKPHRLAAVFRAGWAPAVSCTLTFVATLAMPLQFAVLLGAAASILLHVYRSARAVVLVELVNHEPGVVEERPAPARLATDSVTALLPYGSLFFAGARTLEEVLPVVGTALRPIVILLLRGQEDIGSTFLRVITRYADDLRRAKGRLLLAGIDDALGRQLERTGVAAHIGRENLFFATARYGEAYLRAQGAATGLRATSRTQDSQAPAVIAERSDSPVTPDVPDSLKR